jgi:hypothetical protein
VSYARQFNEMVNRKGGRIVLDHIGFRTLNTHTGEQPGGIWSIRHIFECLGYSPSGKYTFPKKNLNAVHFEPAIKELPKIFVSQLEVVQLPNWAQSLISEAVAFAPYLISDTGIELLTRLNNEGTLTHEAADVLTDELVRYFHRPWNPPPKDTVLKLNDVSHYAAWVLLHGNAPSHLASLVNAQNVAAWPDIFTTCQAMQQAGIPMKEKIEGVKENLLLQTATMAVTEDVTVKENGMYFEIPWRYGYFELVQRGFSRNDHEEYFGKFVEEQERHMYQMTVTLEN